MKNWKDAIKKDFWVLLLDIVAVNMSYLLALLIRFYVNFNLRPVAAEKYFPAWEGFTPFYTILCILIFFVFRLYGGLWRYAGVNDMNRIILSTLCTTVINVAGSCLFFTRMPITYYILGTILQFIFVVAIRFSYRIILVEKRKIRSGGKNRINSIVVGTGENGRRVLKHLEEDDIYKPVAIIGPDTGTLDGIPIVTLNDVKWDDIQVVFIADPLLPRDERQEIIEKCKGKDIDLQDYTGFFSNLGGFISVTELLSVVHGPITIDINGVERSFNSGEEALETFTKKYDVKEIEGKIKIKLVDKKQKSVQETLAQAYASIVGDEPLQGGSK